MALFERGCWSAHLNPVLGQLVQNTSSSGGNQSPEWKFKHHFQLLHNFLLRRRLVKKLALKSCCYIPSKPLVLERALASFTDSFSLSPEQNILIED